MRIVFQKDNFNIDENKQNFCQRCKIAVDPKPGFFSKKPRGILYEDGYYCIECYQTKQRELRQKINEVK